MSEHLLALLIALPLLAAVLVAVMPHDRFVVARRLAWAAMLVEVLASLQLLGADYGAPGYQFIDRVTAGAILHLVVGVDGLSLWLVLATVWLTPALALQCEADDRRRLVSVLWLQGAVVGALVAIDLVFFFLCFELSLGPLWLASGRSDAARRAGRVRLAFEWTTGLALLAGIALLGAEYRAEVGVLSFDLRDLGQLLLPVESQRWLFLLFACAFLVRLPLPPLHGPVAALSTSRSLFAGGLASLASTQLGLYGLMRICMTLFPAGSHRAGVTLVAVAVVGIFFAGLAALGSRDARGVLGYAPLAFSGVAALGLFSITTMGVMGSLVVVLAGAAALALAAASLTPGRAAQGSRAVDARDRVGKFALLAALGLPPFAGFVGLLLVLGGALRAEHLGANGTPLSCFAVLGLALMAGRAFGLSSSEAGEGEGAGKGESGRVPRALALALPLLMLIVLGVHPAPVLERIEPAADHFARVYTAKLKVSDAHPERRGLLERAPIADADADGGDGD